MHIQLERRQLLRGRRESLKTFLLLHPFFHFRLFVVMSILLLFHDLFLFELKLDHHQVGAN